MNKNILYIAIFFLNNFFGDINAQQTFGEYKLVRDSEFSQIDKNIRGNGYKQYERWKWYWEQRCNDDSLIPNAKWVFDIKQLAVNKINLSRGQFKTTTYTDNSSWKYVGVNNSTSGYNGVGRTACMGFHPTNKNIFYVGTPAGGLWKTTDFGQTWQPLTDFLPQIGISSIIVDQWNPNVIYISTGDPDASDAYAVGIFKSTNGGLTWSNIGFTNSISSYTQINELKRSKFEPNVFFCATNTGIYKSVDSCINWTLVHGSANVREIEFDPFDSTVIYAVTKKINCEVLKSTNKGNSFSVINNITGSRRLAFDLSKSTPNVMHIIATDANNGLLSMYKSTDGAVTFTPYSTYATTNVNMLTYSETGGGTGGQGWYDLALAISPSNPNRIMIGGVNLWETTNGGASWTIKGHWYGASGIQPVHADQHNITYHPLDTNIVFVNNDGGVYYRNLADTVTFKDISNGIGNNQIYKITVDNIADTLLLMGLQDNGTKLLDNHVWKSKIGGDGGDCLIDHTDNNNMYAESQNGNIRATTNKFATSVSISNNLPNPGTGAWVTPMILNPNNQDEIYVAYKQIYFSSFRGSYFDSISNFTTTNNITVLANTKAFEYTIFSSDGTRIRYNYDYIQQPWKLISGNTILPMASKCNDIVINQSEAARVGVVFGGYDSTKKCYLTIDSGNTWQNISLGLPPLPALTIEMDTFENHGIYVGTDVGVFYKNDSMTKFESFMNGLPYTSVTDLKINYAQKSIYASTYGRGAWVSKLNLVPKILILEKVPPISNCENTQMTFIAYGNVDTSGQKIKWFKNNILLSTTGSIITINNLLNGDTLQAVCMGSTDTVFSTKLGLSLFQNPIPVIIEATPKNLLSSISNGNQWYKDSVAIPNAIAQTYATVASGTYYVKVTTAQGCVNYSNSIKIIGQNTQVPNSQNVKVYPTYTSDFVFIECAVGQEFHINVEDIHGKTVIHKILTNRQNVIDISSFVAGIYFIEITDNAHFKKVFKIEKN